MGLVARTPGAMVLARRMGAADPSADRGGAGGSEIGGRARRGAALSLLGYGGGKALVFISAPLLSYLIAPEVRGLLELVAPILIGLELLSDLGIGPSIVQNARGHDRRFLDVAWTIQATRGLGLWIIISLAAAPYASITGHAELAYVLPVAGLAAFATGLTSTKIHTASRELSLGRLTAIELGAHGLSFAVKMIFAWMSPTVWALVAGGLTLSLTKLVLGHLLLPGPMNRPRWDPALAREMMRFGRWVLASSILTFATGYADRWIFGAMIPLAALGLFGNAAVVAALPSEALAQIASRVVFPLYARVVRSGEDLAPVFRRARLPLQLAGGWALAGLVAGGPTIMRLLWDEAWWGSGWMIQILAAASWLSLCESTNGAALLARGEPRWIAAGSLAKLLAMCVAIPIGYHLGAFPGALVAYASTEMFRYGVSAWAAARRGLDSRVQDLLLTAMVAATGIGAWRLALWARSAGASVLIEAAVITIAVTLAWAPLAWQPLRAHRRARESLHLALTQRGDSA